jgi:formate hydrogenlyase subunit 3/multisubunit Na+/H+ antiporter MnhD subunit
MQLDFLFSPEYATVMPVLIPIVFAILVAVLSEGVRVAVKRVPKGLPDAIAVIGFALALIYTYMLGTEVWSNGVHTFVLSWSGGNYVMAADEFSVLMMGLFTFMGLVVALYSVGYMKKDTGLAQYYILLLIMVGAMNGVVISTDLFTLYMFYETMGVCSFILVAFRRTWEGIEAAIKYLMMSAIGSTLVLMSASYLYGLTGTLNLALMSQALQAHPENPLVPILIALLTAGFAVKGAAVPFAAWLADAHPAAPSGISAMLSAVVIKVGIYGIIRVNTLLFPIHTIYFDWPLLISIMALVTMTAGNFWALTQKDLKRMLAYSSITQIGFILFAFAFLHAVGSRDLDDLKGVGKTMPVTGAFFAIGVLSLMGMPPLAGFYAKFLILAAGVNAGINFTGYYLLFTVVALFNALLGLGYYLRMIKTVWFEPMSEKVRSAHRASPSVILGMGILAIALLVIGVYPAPIYSIAEAAGSALYNYVDIVNAIMAAGTP